MPATCYRCVSFNEDPVGEPFGVCTECSSLACRNCGNRLPGGGLFRCVLCYPETILLPAAGLEGGRRPPGGGDGLAEPPGSGLELIAASTPDWEAVDRELAEKTAGERRFFHEEALGLMLDGVERYASDEVRREDLNAQVNWEVFDDPAENRRRSEALAGAQWLARSVEGAQANERLRPDLLADAFGVACWAIQLHPQAGETASPDQLSLLADVRLRFAIGMAMPVPNPA
jgi:hypothetical protein